MASIITAPKKTWNNNNVMKKQQKSFEKLSIIKNRRYSSFYTSVFVLLAFTVSMLQWTRLVGLMGSAGSSPFHDGKYHHRPGAPSNGTAVPSFSGCLLIKDDNERLVEWLAYHYAAASLRHLIVAMDPLSSTSPKSIVERWNANTDMNIQLWSDADYMPANAEIRKKKDAIATVTVQSFDFNDQKSRERIKLHMVRQKEFISACLLRHKNDGRKWVFLGDTDEYLVYNRIDKNGKEPKYEESDRKLTKGMKRSLFNVKKHRKDLPAVGSESIAEYAKRHERELPWRDEPCMPLPRLFFGSLESPESDVRKHVPAVITHPSRLNTLRYRRHAEKGSWENNLYDKSIVDVSRTPADSLYHIIDPHWPLEPCKRSRANFLASGKKMSRTDQTLLRVHHYMGSWDAFDSKKITRRSTQKFVERSKVDYGSDDDIRPWVTGFVDLVGTDVARNLLSDDNNGAAV